MVPSLQLPFSFNVHRLQNDLDRVNSEAWKLHFNPRDYEGDWSAIALYAPGGDPAVIQSHHTKEMEILPTPLLSACPYLQEVVEQFQCPILSARLMKLDPGAVIVPHRDYASGYEDGMFRIHIPIRTNDRVEFILNGQRLDMKAGECWYTNVNFEHSVENNGESPRDHLVIDGARNQWSDQLFFSLGPREELLAKEEYTYNREMIIQMIDALRQHKDPAYDVHIENLLNQLDQLDSTE